jgi:hypothetical protein
MRAASGPSSSRISRDVRETMRAVETREQPVHTSDFHFFERERLVCWPLVPLGGEIAESIREIRVLEMCDATNPSIHSSKRPSNGTLSVP